MKKIKSSIDSKLLFTFIFKSIVISAVTGAALSALAAFIIYKLDISFEYSQYFSAVITVITAGVTSYLCSMSFKNSGFLIGIVSIMPMLLFSFINMIVNKNTLWLFIVKLALAVVIAGLSGAFAVKKSKKIRIGK